uniref:Uncharacterized protein n=1 Tax=Chromera velia CCMP2878 TaxID=1169474 RepID=A0A0G4HLH7_9ALVE|eukprot:Cvel_28727.t1-p1 / transcript=Cvel_28727.t1 / gene=Cvel_28727 / organism=Chromera_velia_CCMP2878 / gene_product=Ran GTPase-activating protein 1, putative / transcript_product=Ran GTPase-activating protein 1, putative / location=Cvel_scaffold3814:3216-8334(+) / protein_length=948 / sequence_SO=supercontig / SO=protein_coding / is_pseudo=false
MSENSSGIAGNLADAGGPGVRSMELAESSLCSIFGHAQPNSALICELASRKDTFGLAWVILTYIKTNRSRFPFPTLDLSNFSMGAGKLGLLVASLPSGPETLETLRCGYRVCYGPRLSVLLRFLQRLRVGGQLHGCGGSGSSLKHLVLAECNLNPSEAGAILYSLPPSVQTLDLSCNKLSMSSMETLSDFLSPRWLPGLLHLDVSDNRLGPLGVAALARGLGGSHEGLPLETLRLRYTNAAGGGVKALGEALKAKKTLSLRHLDLESNRIDAEEFRHLASAVAEGSVPMLQFLLLGGNRLARGPEWENNGDFGGQDDFTALAQLLSSTQLRELESLDLSGSFLADEGLNLCAEAVSGGRLPKLKSFKLCHTDMYPLGTVAFMNALETGRTPLLENLELGNVVDSTHETITAFANALNSGHLSKLLSIRLTGGADVYGAGFVALCRSLSAGTAPALKCLDLETSRDPDDEEIDDGVVFLAQGVREGKLAELRNFYFNCFSSRVGAEVMADLNRAVGSGGVRGLQELSLCWHEEEDEGVSGFAEGLKAEGLASLEKLTLNVSCGGEEGCKAFGEALGSCDEFFPCLDSLSLIWRANRGFAGLCEGLSGGERLRSSLFVSISLGRQEIDSDVARDRATVALAGVIRGGKIPGLWEMRLGDFGEVGLGLGRTAGVALSEALTHADACTASLEKLVVFEGFFGGNRREREENMVSFLRGIARGSQSLPSLCVLNLYNEYLGLEGAKGLASLLSAGKVSGLKDLRMNCEDVGHEGLQALAVALCSPFVSQLRALQVNLHLDTFFCMPSLRVAEVASFSVALSFGQLSGLEELYITQSELVGGRGQALCVGLGSGKLQSLWRLDLSDSNVRDEGARELARVLDKERMPSLQNLLLVNTGISGMGLDSFEAAWRTNPPPPLEFIDFSRNPIAPSDGNQILSQLSRTRILTLRDWCV